jgi:hypothetical protein
MAWPPMFYKNGNVRCLGRNAPEKYAAKTVANHQGPCSDRLGPSPLGISGLSAEKVGERQVQS